MALASVVFGVAGCRTGEPPAPIGAPQSATAAPRSKVLYWKSQMVPGYRSDKPGKDPMGMDLMPVYQGEAPAGPPGSVTIDPRTVQQIGVETVTIRRQWLSRDLRTVGRIDYDEQLVRDVAPKIGGWVEKQFVNFPGQLVRKGEALGEIYSPELVSTEEEYLNALKYQGTLKNSPLEDATAGARTLVSAVETRLRYWDITDAQIQALRERGRITRTMVLHAPFTGIVVKKNIFEGGYVNPGESMYQLGDISKVWVYGDIYEYEAPWLGAGQQATMTLAYAPGVTYRGRVIYVYPYLKEKTRTLEVRMEFPNGRNFELKPGMWTDVNIKPEVARDAVVIPIEAVLQTGKRNVAILALGDGHFLPREIKLGAQAGNYFEVLSGLQEGDRVVDSAEFLINSESALESAFNKMTGQPESAGAQSTPSAGGTEPEGMTMPAPQGSAGKQPE
jgi:RND family efflux transporter MFP subunit